MGPPPHSDTSAPPCPLPLHPHTHPSVDFLLCLSHPHLPLLARNRRSEAEPLYRQALELVQRVLGPEHPDTLMAIDSLVVCIKNMGRWAGSDATECC